MNISAVLQRRLQKSYRYTKDAFVFLFNADNYNYVLKPCRVEISYALMYHLNTSCVV